MSKIKITIKISILRLINVNFFKLFMDSFNDFLSFYDRIGYYLFAFFLMFIFLIKDILNKLH